MKNENMFGKGIIAATIVAAGVSAVGMGALMNGAGRDASEPGDEIVTISQVPKAVRKTIEEHARGGKIKQIEKTDEDGTTVYDVEIEKDGHDFEFEITKEGTFLGVDQEDQYGHADEENDGDEYDGEADGGEQVFTIDFSDATRAVRKSFKVHTDDAKPTLVERIVDEGVTKYEIEYTLDGNTASMTFTDRGEVMEKESPVEVHRIPKAIRDEIMRDYPGSTIKAAEAVELFYYEMDVEVDGEVIEVGAFASGDIEDRLVGEQEGDEQGDGQRGNEADEED